MAERDSSFPGANWSNLRFADVTCIENSFPLGGWFVTGFGYVTRACGWGAKGGGGRGGGGRGEGGGGRGEGRGEGRGKGGEGRGEHLNIFLSAEGRGGARRTP